MHHQGVSPRAVGPSPRLLLINKECPIAGFVRDNDVDQALRVLKKKMQREGVFRDMKRGRFFEKPSERTARERSEAIRRRRKLARQQAVRDGLITPKKKIEVARTGTKSGAARSIVAGDCCPSGLYETANSGGNGRTTRRGSCAAFRCGLKS